MTSFRELVILRPFSRADSDTANTISKELTNENNDNSDDAYMRRDGNREDRPAMSASCHSARDASLPIHLADVSWTDHRKCACQPVGECAIFPADPVAGDSELWLRRGPADNRIR